jgi:hypothetical protein
VNQLLVVAVAVCCLAVTRASEAPPTDPRFVLHTGDPSFIGRPDGGCKGESEQLPIGTRGVPWLGPTTVDACKWQRNFRKGERTRIEYWRYRPARDGGLMLENTSVIEDEPSLNVSGDFPTAVGSFTEITVKEFDDAGEQRVETKQTRYPDGGVFRTKSLSYENDTGLYDGEYVDGGWRWRAGTIRCYERVTPIVPVK